jgi:hypothetical protein
MQIATLNDASNHGQELRHLTVHFRDLQGLRMAPFWGALLLLTILGTDRGCKPNRRDWGVATIGTKWAILLTTTVSATY